MADATPVPRPALDAQDRALLRQLLKDGRASHRELAERTGYSLATVNRRVRAMEAAGAIRGYTALVDPEAVGWTLTAVIGLRIDKAPTKVVREST